MTGNIRSDLASANAAVSGLKDKNNFSGQHFSLGESNIGGMKNAVKVSNQIINNTSKISSGVKKQADKFPKLAAVMEQRDQVDARNWGFD